MMVYILFKRFVDMERQVESKVVKSVYADKEEAYAVLESKLAKHDYGWFIVAKQLKGLE
jgi:hypothetical protein